MTQQPTALRLADALEMADVFVGPDDILRVQISTEELDKAAAELRRLHSVNAALIKEVAALSANSLDDYRQIERLTSANTQLLEALEWYVAEGDVCESMPGNEYWVNGLNKARAAIAAANTNR